jgi:acyl-CoA dehydrogenase
VRRFAAEELVPFNESWEREGIVPRELFAKAAEKGMLAMAVGEEHGGAGVDDFRFNQILDEELAYAGVSAAGLGLSLHNDICLPYFLEYCTPEQRERWLPGIADGSLITAIAMTEPGTGSDLAAIKTTAVRDGDHYVINGAKTFISNGILCDLCIVCAKTDPNPENRHRGISLFVVEAGTPGFHKGKKLKKMGLAAQDTSELAFEDCRVPAANLLGDEGSGFVSLMTNLQQERLVVAIGAQAAAEQVLADTIAYVKEREAFGKPIAKFQNTQFKLAECATQVEVGRAFLDTVVSQHVAGKYLVKECSMAKLWQTEMSQKVIDECLQFFGGYGYMLEYPVTRAYMDARVQRIYAGTNEIMKIIISKQMGL